MATFINRYTGRSYVAVQLFTGTIDGINTTTSYQSTFVTMRTGLKIQPHAKPDENILLVRSILFWIYPMLHCWCTQVYYLISDQTLLCALLHLSHTLYPLGHRIQSGSKIEDRELNWKYMIIRESIYIKKTYIDIKQQDR